MKNHEREKGGGGERRSVEAELLSDAAPLVVWRLIEAVEKLGVNSESLYRGPPASGGPVELRQALDSEMSEQQSSQGPGGPRAKGSWGPHVGNPPGGRCMFLSISAHPYSGGCGSWGPALSSGPQATAYLHYMLAPTWKLEETPTDTWRTCKLHWDSNWDRTTVPTCHSDLCLLGSAAEAQRSRSSSHTQKLAEFESLKFRPGTTRECSGSVLYFWEEGGGESQNLSQDSSLRRSGRRRDDGTTQHYLIELTCDWYTARWLPCLCEDRTSTASGTCVDDEDTVECEDVLSLTETI
ncbi:unnamed protein product [Pleuronectes platessa]|uniref:Uncharacterized protein n=1 Tax=Pleuronectes platessa TaxID=8262 RepID=A0A9N7TU14_PLEPL|nr:unnamed protein product [Pleuronectes platessa]